MSKRHKRTSRERAVNLSPGKAQKRLAQGDAAWRDKDCQQALRLWRQALASELRPQAAPRLRRALLELGREAAAAGRWRKAREFLDEATRVAESGRDELERCAALLLALEGQAEKSVATWRPGPTHQDRTVQALLTGYCLGSDPGPDEASATGTPGSTLEAMARDCLRASIAYRRDRSPKALRTALRRDPTPGALAAVRSASEEARRRLAGHAADWASCVNAGVERLATAAEAAVRHDAGLSIGPGEGDFGAVLSAWRGEADAALEAALAGSRELQRDLAAKLESLVAEHRGEVVGDDAAGPGAQLALAAADLLDAAPARALARLDPVLPDIPAPAVPVATVLRQLAGLRVERAAGPALPPTTPNEAVRRAPTHWLAHAGRVGPGLLRELLPSELARLQISPPELLSAEWLDWLDLLDELAELKPTPGQVPAAGSQGELFPVALVDTARWILAGECLKAGDAKLGSGFACAPGLAADCPQKLWLRSAALRCEDGPLTLWAQGVATPARELCRRLPGPEGDAARAVLGEGLCQAGFQALLGDELEAGVELLEEALRLPDLGIRRRAAELLLVCSGTPKSSVRAVASALEPDSDDVRSARLLAWVALRSGSPAATIESRCRELVQRHSGDLELAVALSQALLPGLAKLEESQLERGLQESINAPHRSGVEPAWVWICSALDYLTEDLLDADRAGSLVLQALRKFGDNPDASLTAIGILYSWEGMEDEARRQWDRWVERFGRDRERFLAAVRLAAFSHDDAVVERRLGWAGRQFPLHGAELILELARVVGTSGRSRPLPAFLLGALRASRMTPEQLDEAALPVVASEGIEGVRRMLEEHPEAARVLSATSWTRQLLEGRLRSPSVQRT